VCPCWRPLTQPQFIYLADSHLYPTRWENLVGLRDQVDIVELVTWNDYGESHYLKDPTAADAQPNSQAWVTGFSHAGWLDMTAYYAAAFKTGAYPAVRTDKVYVWARPHAHGAQAPDPVGAPANAALTADAVWAVVLATAPGTLVLDTGAPGGPQAFAVVPGANKFSAPIAPGGGMHATLQRAGQTVVDVHPDFTFDGAPQAYNYNALVAFGSANST
jgi:glucan endo-1,3-alpha-glucosidase